MLLETEFERAFGASHGKLTFLKPSKSTRWVELDAPSISSAASAMSDAWYSKAPAVRNDLVNRHELSSQAAKARRLVVEAMMTSPQVDGLGIEGSGPDRTLYLSVLRAFELHHEIGSEWGLADPPETNTIYPAWECLKEELRTATERRKRISEVLDTLAAPPFGIRVGVSSVLVIASLLMFADEIALYEHGTFKPALTADACERLIRNPENFEIKHFASRSGSRAELLSQVAERLRIDTSRRSRGSRVRSVLLVLSHLVALVNQLPEHIKKTYQLSPEARAIRGDLLSATEPDELFFAAIPKSLGRAPIEASNSDDRDDISEIADALSAAIGEMLEAYPRLLIEIRETLREQFRGPEEGLRENLVVRAKEIRGKVIDPSLARLAVALTAEIPGDDEWAEYVAMNVTGTPPAAWLDGDRARFFSLIHDVGGTFRRIEALNADVRSRGESFDALRLTVTRSDGVEAAKLVWVDEARRTALEPVLTDALRGARAHVGSETEARDLLLAMLAEEDLKSEEPPSMINQESPDSVLTTREEDRATK